MNKAVFTTSDIQRFKGMSDILESTGKLEKAIEQGYEVFVITSRTVFKPEIDDWWRNQVSKVYTGYTGQGATDSGMIETYKQFFRDHNIDPDDMILGFIGCHTEKDSKFYSEYQPKISWMDYADRLQVYGFKIGKDF
jgi:hypothetical protein